MWGDDPSARDEWRGAARGPSDGGGVRLIRELLADLEPYAYDAGLAPSEFRAATFRELHGVIQAHHRRQARELDAMAWVVAHLLVGGGTLRKGTRVDDLMRDLLGREPGTLPGAAPVEPSSRTLSPEATAAYIKGWVHTMRGTPQRVRE